MRIAPRVWEATTGRLVATLAGHTGAVNTASFSPDGRLIVTASTDRTARLWPVSADERFRQACERIRPWGVWSTREDLRAACEPVLSAARRAR